MTIHPKTSGAAVGGALGVLIVAVLHSIPGVHLTPEAAGSIPSFLSLLVAWIVPGSPAVGENPYLSAEDTYKQRLIALSHQPVPPLPVPEERPTGPTAPVA